MKHKKMGSEKEVKQKLINVLIILYLVVVSSWNNELAMEKST